MIIRETFRRDNLPCASCSLGEVRNAGTNLHVKTATSTPRRTPRFAIFLNVRILKNIKDKSTMSPQHKNDDSKPSTKNPYAPSLLKYHPTPNPILLPTIRASHHLTPFLKQIPTLHILCAPTQ